MNNDSTIAETFGKRNVYVNALVHILRKVSSEDIKKLQSGVAAVAPLYRYYSMRPMTTIPTAVKARPDGGALQVPSPL
jgi:hypothetical protein